MVRTCFLTGMCLGVLAMTNGQANAEETPQHPGWLAGCWTSYDGASREVWVSEFDQLLFGYSVTQNEDGLSAFEDMRVERREAGYVFSASPNGHTPVVFVSSAIEHNKIVFENPDHDFPQRISYEREGDQLTARISDIERSSEYSFQMVPCVQ